MHYLRTRKSSQATLAGDYTANPAQPTSLTAAHHSGQTFLTWNERAELPTAHYRIYRHTQPITAANLAQATLLYTVPTARPASFANRYNVEGSGVWRNRYVERFVIADGGAELAAGTGLLVWTLAASDFGGGTADGLLCRHHRTGGQENTTDFGPGNTAGPSPKASPIRCPSNSRARPARRGHIYIQYMDLRDWNPTFHAPNPGNGYYRPGPQPIPRVADAIQYAYDYAIYAPTAAECGGALPSHCRGLQSARLGRQHLCANLANPDPYGWCVYRIYPIDQSETWWFGFAQPVRLPHRRHPRRRRRRRQLHRAARPAHDLRPPARPAWPRRGPQPRLRLRPLHGRQRHPGPGAALPQCLRRRLRQRADDQLRHVRRRRRHRLARGRRPQVGRARRQPAGQLAAPHGWAAPRAATAPASGPGRTTRPTSPTAAATRRCRSASPTARRTRHRVADAGQPVYAPSTPAAAPGAARWSTPTTPGCTSPACRSTWRPTPPPSPPFLTFQVVRNETVPGLSNASSDAPLPPAAPGGYNDTLRWSASWDAWDGAPVDTPTRWPMSFCYHDAIPYVNDCGSGPSLTVDVTPRRLQQFVVVAGARIHLGKPPRRRQRPGRQRQRGGRRRRRRDRAQRGAHRPRRPPPDSFSPSALWGRRHQRLSPTHALTPTIPPARALRPIRLLPQVDRHDTDAYVHSPDPAPLTPIGDPDTHGFAYTWRDEHAHRHRDWPPIGTPRPWPDTTSGIHVFNDQLAANLSDAQWTLCRHPLRRHAEDDAQRRRPPARHQPEFPDPALPPRASASATARSRRLPAHRRLPCSIVEGNELGAGVARRQSVQERWFAHWPAAGSTRVLNCDWGWYLMDLDDAAWRTWWQAEVAAAGAGQRRRRPLPGQPQRAQLPGRRPLRARAARRRRGV